MNPLNPWLPLAYYVAGFFSAIFLGYVLSLRSDRPRSKEKRTWASVQNLKYVLNFELCFNKPITATDLGKWIPYQMQEELVQKPFPEINIKPGDYTVNIEVNARFIEREQNDQSQGSVGVAELDDSQR